MSRGCARTIGPRIRINRPDGASARYSGSNRPDQPNNSCPFTQPATTLSTSSVISLPAARFASYETKLSRRGEPLPRPEVQGAFQTPRRADPSWCDSAARRTPGSRSPAREAGSAALEALPDKRSLSAALQTTRRRPCDRNGARRRGGRRPSFPLRAGTCGVDWPRAASIYDRRQTSARRDWKARQSLSPTPNNSWRPRRHVSFSQTRR